MEIKRVKESPIQKMMNAVERWMMRSLQYLNVPGLKTARLST